MTIIKGRQHKQEQNIYDFFTIFNDERERSLSPWWAETNI